MGGAGQTTNPSISPPRPHEQWEIQLCPRIFSTRGLVDHKFYAVPKNYDVLVTSFLAKVQCPLSPLPSSASSYIFSFSRSLLVTETSYDGRGGGVIECLSPVTATITQWSMCIFNSNRTLYSDQIFGQFE